MAQRWYVVHVYSGFERKVAQSIREQAQQAGMTEIEEVLVPTEEVVEVRRGSKVNAERKFFPGYVLVEMEMDDEAWHLVKNTPKVTGFVGAAHGRKPPPISEKEVDAILRQMQEGVEKPKPKILFEVGESVRVKEGPFTDFHGSVEDVNYDKSKLRVSVTIFGRATPVELDFGQVEKA
jgi:transcriptional antiterminator NusG